MTLTIKNQEIVELLNQLQELTGSDVEAALGALLAAEIPRLRAAQNLDLRPLVFANYLDEEPEARIERLTKLILSWPPIPEGKIFADPDEILGYGKDGVPE